MAEPDAAASPAPRKGTVLVVDDHPIVREGLRAVLDSSPFKVVGEAGDGRTAVEEARRLQPDVILMDVGLPELDGLSATRAIRQALPQALVIILTIADGPEVLRDALRAGACGYLLKGTAGPQIIRSIESVLDGNMIFDAPLLHAALALGVPAPPNPELIAVLSDRERAALRLVAGGRTNREIGDTLGYSTSTIKSTVQAIIEKLGVSDRMQAAVLAVQAGLEPDLGGDESPGS